MDLLCLPVSCNILQFKVISQKVKICYRLEVNLMLMITTCSQQEMEFDSRFYALVSKQCYAEMKVLGTEKNS